MAGEIRGVQSIEVGGKLLQALVDAEQPLSLSQAARAADLPPAQAHTYLVSLVRAGMVEKNDAGGGYSVGPFALQMAFTRMRTFDALHAAHDALIEFAREINLTVALSVWGTHGPTVVQLQECGDHLYTRTRVGTVFSVSGTATGRVFAAYMPEAIVRAAVATENAEGSATHRVGYVLPYKRLLNDIHLVRYQGYAAIEPPPIPGVNAVAAPVFDYFGQLQFAVTLIGVDYVLNLADQGNLVEALKDFAQMLSRQLGHEAAESS